MKINDILVRESLNHAIKKHCNKSNEYMMSRFKEDLSLISCTTYIGKQDAIISHWLSILEKNIDKIEKFLKPYNTRNRLILYDDIPKNIDANGYVRNTSGVVEGPYGKEKFNTTLLSIMKKDDTIKVFTAYPTTKKTT